MLCRSAEEPFLGFYRLQLEVLAVLVFACLFVPLFISFFTPYLASVFVLTENTETSLVLVFSVVGLLVWIPPTCLYPW